MTRIRLGADVIEVLRRCALVEHKNRREMRLMMDLLRHQKQCAYGLDTALKRTSATELRKLRL